MALSHYLVLGLTLGDEGKAGIVDLLAAQSNNPTVIRFAADPHSAHYLVNSNEIVVTFGQIGSGMLNDSCRTHIGHDSLLRLPSLMVEVEELEKLGVSVLNRLSIDPETVLVLPWHVMGERALEIARGTKRLGTLGSGASLVRQGMNENTSEPVRFKDIFEVELLTKKLGLSYSDVMGKIIQVIHRSDSDELHKLVTDFNSRFSIESVAYDLFRIGLELHRSMVHDQDVLRRGEKETLIFEGTQGLLLNPTLGLRPHVAACDSSRRNAECMTIKGEIPTSFKTIGVMRAYSTRFGTGPLVTENSILTEALPELHNDASPWSGEFRAGELDLITSRYALRVSGGIDTIAINHLDRIGNLPVVKVCTAYEYIGKNFDGVRKNFCTTCRNGNVLITDIRTDSIVEEVTQLLFDMKPAEYKSFPPWGEWTPSQGWNAPPPGLRNFLEYLESPEGLDTPISIVSFGVHRTDKYILRAL